MSAPATWQAGSCRSPRRATSPQIGTASGGRIWGKLRGRCWGRSAGGRRRYRRRGGGCWKCTRVISRSRFSQCKHSGEQARVGTCSPEVNRAVRPIAQAAMSAFLRNRRSSIAIEPATRAIAEPKELGSISGTDEGPGTGVTVNMLGDRGGPNSPADEKLSAVIV